MFVGKLEELFASDFSVLRFSGGDFGAEAFFDALLFAPQQKSREVRQATARRYKQKRRLCFSCKKNIL
jgi:hypothetical protein